MIQDCDCIPKLVHVKFSRKVTNDWIMRKFCKKSECKVNKKIDRKCKIQCPVDCQQNHFNVYGKSKKLLYPCAVTYINHHKSRDIIYTYSPQIDIFEFVSNIGGLLGMWIGYSFISFMHIAKATSALRFSPLSFIKMPQTLIINISTLVKNKLKRGNAVQPLVNNFVL